MRATATLTAGFLLLALGSALAMDPGPATRQQAFAADEGDDSHVPAAGQARADTVWFGGLDENGLARADGVWDFDTELHGDTLQGWTSLEMDADTYGVHFGRVTHEDFPAPDPYVPMLPGDPPGSNVGQLWVGLHEGEALLLDFVGGMGYGDDMCQRAFSPEYAYAGQQVDISFNYFNHSEPDFDYSYVYLLCYDQFDDILEEYLVDLLDGVSPGGDSTGAYNWLTPAAYSGTVSAGGLDPATVKVQLELRFYSDGGWSDEDGLWATPAGPFAVDDIHLRIGQDPALVYDFEMDEEGWTFATCPGKGRVMGVESEPVYTQWVEESGLQCLCTLEANALEFVDQENSPFWPPGMPIHWERGISNVIARDPAHMPPEFNTTLLRFDAFLMIPYGCCTQYRCGYAYYPYITEQNPEPHWSPRLGQDTWLYTGDDPECGVVLSNLTTLDGHAGQPCPADWESLRVCFEVYASADYFGIPQTI